MARPWPEPESGLEIDGTSLRAWRNRVGLSQEALAQKIGISFATISRWERGHFAPNRVMLEALRRVMAEVDQQMGAAA